MKTTLRWVGCCGAVCAGALGWGSCVPQPQAPVNNAAISQQIYADQVQLAREALSRQEWLAARSHLTDVVEALGPSDPLGAEARADLAQIAFELGDYNVAAQTAAQVPAGSPFSVQALESQGLAQLFSCDFEHATQTFYQLAQADAARGRVWLGVSFAWTGASGNAERELGAVTDQFGGSEHGPNARFYLAQLALWSRRPGPAQRYLQALNQGTPDYLQTLDTRAQNWLTRHTHLMRAYFTFDTLARLGRLTRASSVAAQDHNADTALQLLQQSPGACAEQVQRLAQARASGASERDAFAQANRDQDGDGIPDGQDRCPAEAETRNGLADEDGCPEATAAIDLDGSQIRIRTGFGIVFPPGGDNVLDDSRPVVDQLVGLLSSPQYSWIRRIRLDGHTDDVGEDAANMDLSQRRVTRVAAMLVSRGVDRGRLNTSFYGEGRPIDPSQSEDARARNRRVEIFIVDPPMFGGVRITQ
ncbi:MAG: OmpA family protein [Deltaproteobacteria bacterium]|nr:OmpA family protein [Deltaproteobacteria bacterium]